MRPRTVIGPGCAPKKSGSVDGTAASVPRSAVSGILSWVAPVVEYGTSTTRSSYFWEVVDIIESRRTLFDPVNIVIRNVDAVT